METHAVKKKAARRRRDHGKPADTHPRGNPSRNAANARSSAPQPKRQRLATSMPAAVPSGGLVDLYNDPDSDDDASPAANVDLKHQQATRSADVAADAGAVSNSGARSDSRAASKSSSLDVIVLDSDDEDAPAGAPKASAAKRTSLGGSSTALAPSKPARAAPSVGTSKGPRAGNGRPKPAGSGHRLGGSKGREPVHKSSSSKKIIVLDSDDEDTTANAVLDGGSSAMRGTGSSSGSAREQLAAAPKKKKTKGMDERAAARAEEKRRQKYADRAEQRLREAPMKEAAERRRKAAEDRRKAAKKEERAGTAALEAAYAEAQRRKESESGRSATDPIDLSSMEFCGDAKAASYSVEGTGGYDTRTSFGGDAQAFKAYLYSNECKDLIKAHPEVAARLIAAVTGLDETTVSHAILDVGKCAVPGARGGHDLERLINHLDKNNASVSFASLLSEFLQMDGGLDFGTGFAQHVINANPGPCTLTEQDVKEKKHCPKPKEKDLVLVYQAYEAAIQLVAVEKGIPVLVLASGGYAVKPVMEALLARFQGCPNVRIITEQPHMSSCTSYRWNVWGGDEILQLHSCSVKMLRASNNIDDFIGGAINRCRRSKGLSPLPPADVFGRFAAHPKVPFIGPLEGEGWDAAKRGATAFKIQQNRRAGFASVQSQFGHMSSSEISDHMSWVASHQWEGLTAEQRQAKMMQMFGLLTKEEFSAEQRRRAGWADCETADERKALQQKNMETHFRKTGRTQADVNKAMSDGHRKARNEGQALMTVLAAECPRDDDGILPKAQHRMEIPVNSKQKRDVPNAYEVRCSKCNVPRYFYKLEHYYERRRKYDAKKANPCHVEGCKNKISTSHGKGKFCRKHS